MIRLDTVLVEQFKQIYLQICGEELGTNEAERELSEFVKVLQATIVERKVAQNAKNI